MNSTVLISGLGKMFFLRMLSRFLGTASISMLASLPLAADPPGLFPGVADNKVPGGIANPSAFSTNNIGNSVTTACRRAVSCA